MFCNFQSFSHAVTSLKDEIEQVDFAISVAVAGRSPTELNQKFKILEITGA